MTCNHANYNHYFERCDDCGWEWPAYDLTDADRASAKRLAASATMPRIIEWMAGWTTAHNDPRQAQQLAIGRYALELPENS